MVSTGRQLSHSNIVKGPVPNYPRARSELPSSFKDVIHFHSYLFFLLKCPICTSCAQTSNLPEPKRLNPKRNSKTIMYYVLLEAICVMQYRHTILQSLALNL